MQNSQCPGEFNVPHGLLMAGCLTPVEPVKVCSVNLLPRRLDQLPDRI